jgi:hypothetical protein
MRVMPEGFFSGSLLIFSEPNVESNMAKRRPDARMEVVIVKVSPFRFLIV